MSEAAAPTPLQIHTLDTLLDELVSGRPVALSGSLHSYRNPNL